jgi:ribokinase
VITVIGSLIMDLVTYVTRLPKVGETTMGTEFKQIPGGKGANQAVAIAKLGVPVKLLGGVGDDAMSKVLLAALWQAGVDISQIGRFADTTTGIASIMVDGDGQNLTAVTPGANCRFLTEHLQKLETVLEDSSIVVTQLEIPLETVKYSLQVAKQLGKTTILNPDPVAALDAALLACVDILISNQTELEFLSGMKIKSQTELVAAAYFLIDRGVHDVIVTLGAKGCVYVNAQFSWIFAAPQVTAADTTTAGDSFVGGLAVALSEGKRIEAAIPFAMAAAALTVTKKGAQSSLPGRDEVEELLSRRKRGEV